MDVGSRAGGTDYRHQAARILVDLVAACCECENATWRSTLRVAGPSPDFSAQPGQIYPNRSAAAGLTPSHRGRRATIPAPNACGV
jgi:hypothetical protein